MSLKFICFSLLLFLGSSTSCEITYHINEEIPNNTFVGDLSEHFPGDKNEFTFTFSRDINEYTPLFYIDAASNKLLTSNRIDRDSLCEKDECELKMKLVMFLLPKTFKSICQLKIIVEDINDNAPFFENAIISREIDESLKIKSIIYLKGAHDHDVGVNAVKFYELYNELDKFALKFEENGFFMGLVLKSQLDYEKKKFYNLTLVAKDNGIPQQSGSVIVHLTVKDINDNKPQFTEESYNVDIYENASISSTVLTLSARDADSAENGQVRYKFFYNVKQSVMNVFSINKTSGEIILKKQVDYERKSKYSFKVVGFDNGFQPQSSIVSVNINVLNINDNKPDIFILHVSDNVSESDKIGDTIARISVSDEDDHQKDAVNCSLNNSYFRLDSSLNQIMIAKQLDFEKCPVHNVTILCYDYGEPQLQSHKAFLVHVHDENDNAPLFKSPILIDQYENNEFKAFQVVAEDYDFGINSKMDYDLINDSVSSLFNISHQVGLITTNVKFDREKTPELEFKVLATDRGNPPLTGTGTVTVRILDVNDEIPTFKKDYYEFHVKERQASSTFIGKVEAQDLDTDENARLFYWIPNDNESSEYFYVLEGILKTKRTLNYSKNLRYYFTVFASDHGIPPLSSWTNVTVFVDDVNDNAPYFVYPTFHNNSISIIYEMTATNRPVAKIIAYDEDDGENAKLSYFLTNSPASPGLFRINHSSGEIMLVKNTNVRAQEKPIKLTVTVIDHGKPSLQNTSILYVTVDFGNKTWTLSDLNNHPDDENKKIGIILGIVTACLLVCVIVVTCIVRRIDDNRRRYPPKKLEDIALNKYLERTVSPQVSLNLQKDSNATAVGSLQPQGRTESETTEYVEEEKEINECLNNTNSEKANDSLNQISLQGSCAALLE